MGRFDYNKPKPLKDLISGFIKEYPHRKKLMKGMVLAVWNETVGEAIAEQTRDIYFKNQKLIVHVGNSAWRHEIHMKRFHITKKLNEKIGEDIVKEIIVKA